MKTPEELYATESAKPPLREYYVVWERPKGSWTWTQHGGMLTDRDGANDIARRRVDDTSKPPCDCVVTEAALPRMPHPASEGPYATLCVDDVPSLYFGRNVK